MWKGEAQGPAELLLLGGIPSPLPFSPRHGAPHSLGCGRPPGNGGASLDFGVQKITAQRPLPAPLFLIVCTK